MNSACVSLSCRRWSARATVPVFRRSFTGFFTGTKQNADAGDSSVLVCIFILRCLHLQYYPLAASQTSGSTGSTDTTGDGERGTGNGGRRTETGSGIYCNTCLPACLVTVPALLALIYLSFGLLTAFETTDVTATVLMVASLFFFLFCFRFV